MPPTSKYQIDSTLIVVAIADSEKGAAIRSSFQVSPTTEAASSPEASCRLQPSTQSDDEWKESERFSSPRDTPRSTNINHYHIDCRCRYGSDADRTDCRSANDINGGGCFYVDDNEITTRPSLPSSLSPPPSPSLIKWSSCSPRGTNLTSPTSLLFLLVLSFLLLPRFPVHGQSLAPVPCPTQCFCNNVGKIVYCSRKGLKAIPPALSPDTFELNLSNNVFLSSELHPSNFSNLRQLKYLYLSDCGLERIRLGTFAGLGNLLFLDLSNNRLKHLAEETFKGLKLQHLFLNGNRQLQLGQGSFQGLQTHGLYLQDCSLSEIQPSVLEPLKISLRYLGLNGNELVKLDDKLLDIFNRLDHLRLGSNPLHCNCESLWLKEFFDKRGVGSSSDNSAPSCLTPPRMKGLFFSNFSSSEMRCTPPVFGDIEATFSKSSGRLKCSARGDPKPTVYWIDPSGAVSKFPPSTDNDMRATEALLQLEFQSRDSGLVGWQNLSSDQNRKSRKARTTVKNRNHDSTSQSEDRVNEGDASIGSYICMASNVAGNVTLTVNVSWPLSDLQDAKEASSLAGAKTSQGKPQAESGDNEAKDSDFELVNLSEEEKNARPAVGDSFRQPGDSSFNNGVALATDDDTGSRAPSDDHRLYSVFEMACAVVGTFLATLVVCLLALVLFIIKNRDKNPPKAQNGSGKPTAPPLPHPYPHHLIAGNTSLHQQHQLAIQHRGLLQHQQQLLDSSSGPIDSEGSHLYAETTSPLFPSGTYTTSPVEQRATGGFDFRSYQLQHAGLINIPTVLPPEDPMLTLRERGHHPYIHPQLQSQPYPYLGTTERQSSATETFYPNGSENRICNSYAGR